LPHHGKRKENPFCARVADTSRSCAACLQVQQKLAETSKEEAQTVACPLGLCDSAVPVRLGNTVIGFLQTGQMFRRKPGEAQFARASKLLADWGVEADPNQLRKEYFNTQVLSPTKHDSAVKLLTIFAQHLSMVSNQVIVHQKNAEPPVITRAKEYIQQHEADELSLGEVAKAVNTSSFYFCKLFKKITGLNFTHYVSRVRVEKAKNLLLNPNLRVSEIAFEVGFQSLTHFNRVFKKIIGQSPTEYRAQLASA
jgi:AraC-like DNA-binding protein